MSVAHNPMTEGGTEDNKEVTLVSDPVVIAKPAGGAGNAGSHRKWTGEYMMFPSVVLYRINDAFLSLSVRYKIAGTLIAILLLTAIALGAVTFSRQKTMLEQEMKNRAQVLVQQLANVGKEGLLTKQELPVFTTITDFKKSGWVVYAMVTDADGKVFVHSDLSKKGALQADKVSLRSIRSDALFFQNTEDQGGPVMDAAMPIITKSKNLKIGTARIGISMKALNDAIHRQKVIFFWIAMAFAAFGLTISFALGRILTRPIFTLSEGMQNVARGDVSVLIKVRLKDEIGRLAEAFNGMILSLREKLHMEKYLSGSAVKSIRRHRDAAHLRLGGEEKYVTALFSDVRGFTSLSEKMKPEEVVGLLNIYLNLQAKVIHQWGGVVDKFVGDEVMAIFEGKGEEIRAARAAVEIQRYCTALNEARSATGAKQIQIGIGLNNGDVIMGNMGSEDHMDYTVIGDTINVAARLCGIARPGQIVVSKTIADEIGSLSVLKKLEPVMLKGKDKPTEVHEVVEVKGAARQEMRQIMEVPVEYQLAGLAEEKDHGIAKNLSSWGCLLEVPTPIGIGSKLTISFELRPLGTITVDGTVHHTSKKNSKYSAGVHFLDIHGTSRFQLVEWIHQVESDAKDGKEIAA
jgi:adenylate cyclase